MSPDQSTQLLSQLLWQAVVISAPLLLSLLVVGVLVSILQVVTQIQEMTLTFIPKLIVAVVVMAALGPWMLGHLMEYATLALQQYPAQSLESAMGSSVAESWSLASLLVWVRLSAMLLLSPLTTTIKMPTTFVVLLTLALAGSFAQGLPVPPLVLDGALDVGALAMRALFEVMVGATLGFALHCALGVATMAGNLIDIQMGLGIGAIYNPVTRQQSPVLGSILAMFAAAYFFALDAPHALLRAFAFSLERVPLGTPWMPGSLAAMLLPFGAMFTSAVMLAAPVLFVLLLVEVLLLVSARVLPQMNVFFVGLPAKILVGLVALAFTASFIGPSFNRSFVEMVRWWDGVLA